MMNPIHALVFAMLSTASGWGLPSSHDDSLPSPADEAGDDGPRDPRQLEVKLPPVNTRRSCDSSWCDLPAPLA